MHALQRPFKVFLEICKGPRQRAGASNQDIVMVRKRRALAKKTHCGAQTPFNAVALDSPAHLLGYRESEPGRRRLRDRRGAASGRAIAAEPAERGLVSKTKEGVAHRAPPLIRRNSARFLRVTSAKAMSPSPGEWTNPDLEVREPDTRKKD